jgi:DNA-binding LacI/PurR family transcriptional regulator
VVALNDTMAIGAMHAAQNRGELPGRQFSVVGFDDSPMAEYFVAAAHEHQPAHSAGGRKCVEMLVSLLTGQAKAERRVLLQPELSCASRQGQLIAPLVNS